MSYKEQVSFLAELETFDANAYIGNVDVPQQVCNLMLSLAAAYNNLRDVFLFQIMLSEIDLDLSQQTPEVGQFNALANSALRLQAGLLNELLVLVSGMEPTIRHESFQRVVKRLSPKGRDSWKSLLDVSQGRYVKGKLGKALMLIRNKVAFHYDSKTIARGYRNCFKSREKERPPLISRGGSMKETRFYFADAAIQDYMSDIVKVDGTLDALVGYSSVLEWVNQALFELVMKFPASRGYAWRRFNAPN